MGIIVVMIWTTISFGPDSEFSKHLSYKINTAWPIWVIEYSLLGSVTVLMTSMRACYSVVQQQLMGLCCGCDDFNHNKFWPRLWIFKTSKPQNQHNMMAHMGHWMLIRQCNSIDDIHVHAIQWCSSNWWGLYCCDDLNHKFLPGLLLEKAFFLLRISKHLTHKTKINTAWPIWVIEYSFSSVTVLMTFMCMLFSGAAAMDGTLWWFEPQILARTVAQEGILLICWEFTKHLTHKTKINTAWPIWVIECSFSIV